MYVHMYIHTYKKTQTIHVRMYSTHLRMYIHTREHKLLQYVHTYWRSTSECALEVSYLTPLRTQIVIRYSNSTDYNSLQ